MNVSFESVSLKELSRLNEMGCETEFDYADRTVKVRLPDKVMLRIVR